MQQEVHYIKSMEMKNMPKIYNSIHTRMKRMGEIKIGIALVVIIPILIVFLYMENNYISSTYMYMEFDRLPKSFDGYTIVHLSDLHNKKFGKDQKYLVAKIEKANPDLIVYTGDLIDSRRHGMDNSIRLMEECVKIAPVYYVTGNHEWRTEQFALLQNALIEAEVQILQDDHYVIENGQDKIYILGIDDPMSAHSWEGHGEGVLMENFIEMEEDIIRDSIEKATMDIAKEDTFKILLTHRPEKLPIYSEFDIDMIFAGHAHGGQIRLPFVGGVVAPNQGFFPKYTSGKHVYGNSTMVISRGLGNSIAPQRLFNRPEVIRVTLRSSQ